jgi:hypothetical protein
MDCIATNDQGRLFSFIGRSRFSLGGFTIIISARWFLKEHDADDAQAAYYADHGPGALFHYISGLLHAHYLGAHAAKCAGKAAAFRVLYQNKEPEDDTGQKYEDYNKSYHDCLSFNISSILRAK